VAAPVANIDIVIVIYNLKLYWQEDAMSTLSLNAIITKAVVSDRFRAGLLNGQRAVLIRDFDLDPAEVSAIMSIHVASLAEFAAVIDQLLQTRDLASAHLTRNRNVTTNRFISR
jgi:hypothetical protein